MQIIKILYSFLFFTCFIWGAELNSLKSKQLKKNSLENIISEVESKLLKEIISDHIFRKDFIRLFEILESKVVASKTDAIKLHLILGSLLLHNCLEGGQNCMSHFVSAVIKDCINKPESKYAYNFVKEKIELEPKEQQFRLKFLFYNRLIDILEESEPIFLTICIDMHNLFKNSNMLFDSVRYLNTALNNLYIADSNSKKVIEPSVDMAYFKMIRALPNKNLNPNDLKVFFDLMHFITSMSKSGELSIIASKSCLFAISHYELCKISFKKFCLSIFSFLDPIFCLDQKFRETALLFKKSCLSKDVFKKEFHNIVNKLFGSNKNIEGLEQEISHALSLYEQAYSDEDDISLEIKNLNKLYSLSNNIKNRFKMMFFMAMLHENEMLYLLRDSLDKADKLLSVTYSEEFQRLRMKSSIHYNAAIYFYNQLDLQEINSEIRDIFNTCRLKFSKLECIKVSIQDIQLGSISDNLEKLNSKVNIEAVKSLNSALITLLSMHNERGYNNKSLHTTKVLDFLIDTGIRSLINNKIICFYSLEKEKGNDLYKEEDIISLREVEVLLYEVYQYMYGLGGVRDLDLAYNLLLDLEKRFKIKIDFIKEMSDLKSEISDKLIREAEEKNKIFQAQLDILSTDVASSSSPKNSSPKNRQRSRNSSNSATSSSPKTSAKKSLDSKTKSTLHYASAFINKSVDFDLLIMQANDMALLVDGSSIALDRAKKRIVINDTLRKCKYFFNYKVLELNDYGIFEPYKFTYDKRVSAWFSGDLTHQESAKIESHRFCIAVDFIIQLFGKYIVYESEYSKQKQNSLIMEMLVEEDNGAKYKAQFEYTFYVNSFHKEILYHRLLRKINS